MINSDNLNYHVVTVIGSGDIKYDAINTCEFWKDIRCI